MGNFKVQKHKKSPLRHKGSSNADTHIARWAARLLMYYVEYKKNLLTMNHGPVDSSMVPYQSKSGEAQVSPTRPGLISH